MAQKSYDLVRAEAREAEERVVTYTTLPCIWCRTTSEVTVEYASRLLWELGYHVQDAFPYLSPDHRDLLLNGSHPECWPKEEDEDQ